MMVHKSTTLNARQVMSQLITQRSKMEQQLKIELSILEQNNIGMNEPLVDSDDYPRSDIDVYKVRHARHRIICIRNDLKTIMADIEKQLHIIHAQNIRNGNIVDTSVRGNLCEMEPFIRVNMVSYGSPADEAGLMEGDLITKFGSLNSTNFEALKDVSTIVNNSINQDIAVAIIRNNRRQQLQLKPHRWSGDGLIGCTIVPY